MKTFSKATNYETRKFCEEVKKGVNEIFRKYENKISYYEAYEFYQKENGITVEKSIALAKIGNGHKVHRVQVECWFKNDVRYIMNAYSFCGSSKFTANGRSHLFIMTDSTGAECNCKKCMK